VKHHSPKLLLLLPLLLRQETAGSPAPLVAVATLLLLLLLLYVEKYPCLHPAKQRHPFPSWPVHRLRGKGSHLAALCCKVQLGMETCQLTASKAVEPWRPPT